MSLRNKYQQSPIPCVPSVTSSNIEKQEAWTEFALPLLVRDEGPSENLRSWLLFAATEDVSICPESGRDAPALCTGGDDSCGTFWEIGPPEGGLLPSRIVGGELPTGGLLAGGVLPGWFLP